MSIWFTSVIELYMISMHVIYCQTFFFSSAMLGSPGAGLQNPISTVGPGQPTPTAISSAATHIDPSSMQRAYAALGLPYGNQSPAQVQGQGLSQQKLQGTQHQQLQNMNPLGTVLV